MATSLEMINKPEYIRQPDEVIATDGLPVNNFYFSTNGNYDKKTVESFGEEWTKFNRFSLKEVQEIGADYFDILPMNFELNKATILDLGCGTGRWALYLANNAGFIDCVDPSDAVYSAAILLKGFKNIRINKTDVDHLPFNDQTYDLVYSLGVLHHIPDTGKAMQACVDKVKKGGFFLVYLYYNLDNRGLTFRMLYHFTNLIRKFICKTPAMIKKPVCDLIAAVVYYPIARSSLLFKKIGFRKFAEKIPLSYYADRSFWIMKNDALDRFGTPLEQRFSKKQIVDMMAASGLINIIVSPNKPYWHAIGQKI
jgi:SAM-dependent methyltransferase